MRGRTRLAAVRVASALLLVLLVATVTAACGGSPSTPRSTGGGASNGAPGGGEKLAPGLYDLGDGTVRAVGTCAYSGLEGGFWAVLGEPEGDGVRGRVIVVVANGDDFASQLRRLDGLSVIVTGVRLEGGSIRMAGPEMRATSVVAANDPSAPAP